jgi:hypothetical protein
VAVTVRGIGTDGANATAAALSRTPPITSGTAAGELMVAAFCWSNTVNTLTPPSGWTALPGTVTQTNDNLAVYYRYFVPGDANPVFTLSSTAETCAAVCVTFSGAAASGAPVEASVLGGTASTTVTYPAITPAHATDLLVYLAGLRVATVSTQVTLSTLPAGGTGGTVTSQGVTCTNVGSAANSAVAVLTQQLTAATAVAQETSTASTSVSDACVALCVTAAPAGPSRAVTRAQQQPPPQAAAPARSRIIPAVRTAGVPVSSADSAAAADAARPVTVQAADTGHGAEAASAHAALSSPDSGHALEGSPARVALSSPDSGHGPEAASAHAAVPGADTGHAAEGSPPSVRLSGPDSGSAAEHGPVHAALSQADTGHGSDTQAPSVRVAGSDHAGGLEAGGVVAAVSKGDTAHGLEGFLIRVAGADSGHGAEGSPARVAVSSADSGPALEHGSVPGTPHGTDSAHGLEAGSVHAAAGGADAGHGAEGSSVHAALAAPDAGHGTEAGSVHAALSSADSGHAAESGSTGHTVLGADAVLAVESAFYYRSSADTAHAAEGALLRVHASDAASPADRPLNAWPSAHDVTGKTAERGWQSGPLASADAGHAAEAVRPFPFAGADSAFAAEVLHEMGIWTYIPVNVRLSGRFWRVTGRDEQGNEVVLLEAERLSGDLLELAERVRLSRIRKVRSADGASAGEAVAWPPVAVTCWVQPAVAVSVTVTAVPVPAQVTA